MQGQAATTIAAPPDAVYDLVADLARMGEWSPECRRCELDEGQEVAEGAWFTGFNAIKTFEWETRSQIIAARRGEELAWAVGGAERPFVTWRYRFTPDGDGGTLVEESFVAHVVPPPLHDSTPEQLAKREARLVTGLGETLARLKQAAEQPAAAG